jgi:superfamily II DNA or RNA helicase
MSMDIFQAVHPHIDGNDLLRIPQKEAYAEVEKYYQGQNIDREIGIVLPVGCGKSGLITLIPFATKAKRVLVIAPGVNIAKQLHDDFDPTNPKMFYIKCRILDGSLFPEPVEIRGTTTNRSDLDEADVVVTNIQQLQGQDNRWLTSLPSDYFDLILFDEAHHNVASSWEILRQSFPDANIVNFSATPRRADGKLMAGNIVYCYSIFRAIESGYVKRLKAIVLNPKTLKYVRDENGEEITVSLDEVRRLGESDSDFRRSIVTSSETLYTIVDASIRELNRIRTETGEMRHKIIASALNYKHCIQVVEAYRARGLRAEYVHSRLESSVNARVFNKLTNHEIDVIVQVRKLGEGFDHPYLSVAAVFSIFRELSPFVQYVGRIMRVIDQNRPDSPNNQGTVVFHAGGNIARLWEDFQDFSQADQEFFDQLLPLEGLNFNNGDELQIEPTPRGRRENSVEIRNQEGVVVEEIPLILEDTEVQEALKKLREKGVTPELYRQVYEHHPLPTTKVRQRQAARSSLDDIVKNETGRILRERGINPEGYTLDKKHLGKTNFVLLKSTIDKKINEFVGRGPGERSEFTKTQLDSIMKNLQHIITLALEEVS